MGELKPSSLLREMRNLAGASITPDLLKTLFLQRLPLNIQAILSISSEGIDSLANMADKIYETTSSRNNEIASTSRAPCLQTQIAELSRQIAEMKSSFSSRGREGNNNNYKFRSRSRSNTPSRKSGSAAFTSEPKLCWYHSKWGDKATSCAGNCSFKTMPGN